MGHRIISTYPVPSGWRAICACGHTTRGPRAIDAIDTMYATHLEVLA